MQRLEVAIAAQPVPDPGATYWQQFASRIESRVEPRSARAYERIVAWLLPAGRWGMVRAGVAVVAASFLVYIGMRGYRPADWTPREIATPPAQPSPSPEAPSIAPPATPAPVAPPVASTRPAPGGVAGAGKRASESQRRARAVAPPPAATMEELAAKSTAPPVAADADATAPAPRAAEPPLRQSVPPRAEAVAPQAAAPGPRDFAQLPPALEAAPSPAAKPQDAPFEPAFDPFATHARKSSARVHVQSNRDAGGTDAALAFLIAATGGNEAEARAAAARAEDPAVDAALAAWLATRAGDAEQRSGAAADATAADVDAWLAFESLAWPRRADAAARAPLATIARVLAARARHDPRAATRARVAITHLRDSSADAGERSQWESLLLTLP